MNQPVPLHSCPASHEPSVVVLGQMGVACLQVFINCIFTICCGWPFINPNNQIQFKSKIHSFGGWGTAHERSVCSEHKAVVCSKHHRNPDTFTSIWKHSPHQLRSCWRPTPAWQSALDSHWVCRLHSGTGPILRHNWRTKTNSGIFFGGGQGSGGLCYFVLLCLGISFCLSFPPFWERK